MPKLLNGIKGDSNPGSLDCESGILPLSYRAPSLISWLVTVVYAIAIGVASGEVATEHSVLTEANYLRLARDLYVIYY